MVSSGDDRGGHRIGDVAARQAEGEVRQPHVYAGHAQRPALTLALRDPTVQVAANDRFVREPSHGLPIPG
ncbi:hypothetical protein HPB50_000185 [Hyalomma asiaticum]|uniref:Uncharacterized protein n=1 Tax=Hyalomma asiaticum TaxID=266040 RepID=A0ACB7S9K8_HYAAI|nr:hypothetical protein HPB50_000185 [Hyalomma asiaticum]